MFVAVIGTTCSGKRTVVDYLVSQEFIEISITASSTSTPAPNSSHSFSSANELLDFVTRHWRQKFVILLESGDLVAAEFSVRPFFVLLNVDAPIMTRWRRLKCVKIMATHLFLYVYKFVDMAKLPRSP